MTAAFFALQTSGGEQIRELNRAGKWDEAAALAKSFDANGAESNREKCRILQSLIYSQTRLNRTDEAQIAQQNYDKLCRAGELPPKVNLKMSKPSRAIADDFRQTEEPAKDGISSTTFAAHQDLCERISSTAYFD